MKKIEREITRAFLHMAIGMSITSLFWFRMINGLHLFVLLIFSGIASLVYKKIRPYYKIPIISFLERYERPRDLRNFPGKGFIMLLVGMLLAYKLFPFDIAMASMVVVSVLDPVSRAFGMTFGRTINFLDPKKRKYIEGHIMGMIASFFINMLFVSPLEAAISAVAGAVSESVIVQLNGEAIDDNIVVPLAVGTALLIFRMYV